MQSYQHLHPEIKVILFSNQGDFFKITCNILDKKASPIMEVVKFMCPDLLIFRESPAASGWVGSSEYEWPQKNVSHQITMW